MITDLTDLFLLDLFLLDLFRWSYFTLSFIFHYCWSASF